jgi:plasmid stabilization system protein ParE
MPTLGLSASSFNVLLVCNYCNFRDVVYYADTKAEAAEAWERLQAARKKLDDRCQVRRSGRMPKLRIRKYGAGRGGRWAAVALLQELRSRISRAVHEREILILNWRILWLFD